MLVLSRKTNDSIVINEDIVLTVIEIRGDKVRLGIVCPKEIPIHRGEFHDCLKLWNLPQSPEEDAFHQAIRANPTDETTWLVYADWLEERGDPRAASVRASWRRPDAPPQS